MSKAVSLLIVVALAAASIRPLDAQDVPATQQGNGNFVTREEYDKLKTDFDAIRKEMATMKQQAYSKQDAEARSAETEQIIDEILADMKKRKTEIDGLSLGSSKFLITGYAYAGFSNQRQEGSSFNAAFAPIFLWKVNERLFVEAETEIGLEKEDGENKTTLHLEYADINYLVNDYLTIRAGQFLTPFGQFVERLHPAWINKLPTFPLVYREEGGLVPFSTLGAEARGAFPIGPTKINYAFYVGNGPALVTDDPDRVGMIDGDNFVDNNNGKAVGGRVGFLPIPELELGYSVQYARVSASGASDTASLLQGVDMSYRHDSDLLLGQIEARAEWVWSNLGSATYDADGSLGFGPLTINKNNSNGGYLQLAYRPTKVNYKFLRDIEFVTRYDLLDVGHALPDRPNERAVTFGINYWLGPSTVIKTAYQFDDRQNFGNFNAFFVQFAAGF